MTRPTLSERMKAIGMNPPEALLALGVSIDDIVAALIEDAILAERAACARTADAEIEAMKRSGMAYGMAKNIADEIRKRSLQDWERE